MAAACASQVQEVRSRPLARRALAALLALGLAIATLAVLLASDGFALGDLRAHLSGMQRTAPARRLKASGSQDDLIHVCLSSDDTDLRAIAVAIRSCLAAAREPEKLQFHLVTAEQLVTLFQEVIKVHLPDVPIKLHHNTPLQQHLQNLIEQRDTSRARKSLASPFNFAPFYLHEFISGRRGAKGNIDRLIYLDADAVVLGDVAELHSLDLQGRTVAAVKNCALRWEDYIDFEALFHLGFKTYDPDACVIGRGIFVYDVARWVDQNMTGKVEDWMDRYKRTFDDLWFDGMTLAPWMLAVDDDFVELGGEWDCNGASRESMTIPESQHLRRSGFDYMALRTLETNFSEYGRVQPYVVQCSSTAKMLHFNGGMRPWIIERFGKIAPICAEPSKMEGHKWKWRRQVKVYCEESNFVACPEIWWNYISEETACALKDFDKEWIPDEQRWMDHQVDNEEAKRMAEREWREGFSAAEKERLERLAILGKEKRRERFRLHWGSESEPWKQRDGKKRKTPQKTQKTDKEKGGAKPQTPQSQEEEGEDEDTQ